MAWVDFAFERLPQSIVYKPRKWHWLSLPPIGALDNKIEFQKFTRRTQPKFVVAKLNDKALIKLK